jgi:hypothetical protein
VYRSTTCDGPDRISDIDAALNFDPFSNELEQWVAHALLYAWVENIVQEIWSRSHFIFFRRLALSWLPSSESYSLSLIVEIMMIAPYVIV